MRRKDVFANTEQALTKLALLMCEHRGPTDEKYAILHRLEDLYEMLSPDHVEFFNLMSGDLYQLEQKEQFFRDTDPHSQAEKAKRLWNDLNGANWTSVLHRLRYELTGVDDATRASLRARAYQALYCPHASLAFSEHAWRRDPENNIYQTLWLLRARSAVSETALEVSRKIIDNMPSSGSEAFVVASSIVVRTLVEQWQQARSSGQNAAFEELRAVSSSVLPRILRSLATPLSLEMLELALLVATNCAVALNTATSKSQELAHELEKKSFSSEAQSSSGIDKRIQMDYALYLELARGLHQENEFNADIAQLWKHSPTDVYHEELQVIMSRLKANV